MTAQQRIFVRSILERLRSNKVLNVNVSKNKEVVMFQEACDLWFSVDLNKSEFGLLIAELKALHDQMIDV